MRSTRFKPPTVQLRPRDYFEDPHQFGAVLQARMRQPEGGDDRGFRRALVQHRVALLLRARARPGGGPGERVGRAFGFSRQHWSDCQLGKAWMGEDTLTASLAVLLGLLDEISPPSSSTGPPG
jgi:hypothetical protein